MAEYKLGEIETIFADIIWDNEPLSSRCLATISILFTIHALATLK